MLHGYVILFFLLSMVPKGKTAPLCSEARLVSDLLTNYNPNVKPTMNANKKMVVNVTFSLGRIESLNEKDQILTSFGWMSLFWYDELLKWNPAAYDNTYKTTLPGSQIWIPEIALINSVNQGNDLAFEAKFRVNVYANGMVQWGPGFKWETSCSVKLQHFPFDQHVCQVLFTNWMYGGEQLVYQLSDDEPSMITDLLEPNAEWDLTNTTVVTEMIQLQTGDFIHEIPSVYFNVTLTRNPNFHVWNVLVPSMLMTFMAVMVFMLPSESGEKVGLGITVLLGFSVILLMMSDITPKSGDSMPHISQYIVFSMILTSLSLVCTLVVLNLHHHNPNKRMPKFLRLLLLKGLGRLVCMARPDTTMSNAVEPINLQPQHDNNALKEKNSLRNENSPIPEDILAFIRKKMADDEEEERLSQNKEEWEHAANVLDRFLLIFSFLGIAIMSSAYLIVIVEGF